MPLPESIAFLHSVGIKAFKNSPNQILGLTGRDKPFYLKSRYIKNLSRIQAQPRLEFKSLMNPLKLRAEDCSAFGQMVLQYLEENPQTNMSQLAKQVRISRAGLGWVCLKRSGPDEETAARVAQIINADLGEIARLVHENKLENLANLGGLNYIAELNGRSVARSIPAEDAVAALNLIFRAFHEGAKSIPAAEKPSDFQIYKQAFEIVKAQFLRRRKKIKQRKESVATAQTPDSLIPTD